MGIGESEERYALPRACMPIAAKSAFVVAYLFAFQYHRIFGGGQEIERV
jgi:hypothetical protein